MKFRTLQKHMEVDKKASDDQFAIWKPKKGIIIFEYFEGMNGIECVHIGEIAIPTKSGALNDELVQVCPTDGEPMDDYAVSPAEFRQQKLHFTVAKVISK